MSAFAYSMLSKAMRKASFFLIRQTEKVFAALRKEHNRIASSALIIMTASLVLLPATPISHAFDLSIISIDKDIRFHGFASQGFIFTDENNFFGNSQTTSWEFTDIGIGTAWRPNTRIQLSAQAIYRQAGDTAPTGINLDYGMISYSITNRPEFGLQLRGGRIKTPLGLYNETRDVAITKPSILLPQSTYRESLRSSTHAYNGFGLNSYIENSNHLITFDFLIGSPNLEDYKDNEFAGILSSSTNIIDEQVSYFRMMIEPYSHDLRLGLTLGELHFHWLEPTLGNPITPNPEFHLEALIYLFSFDYQIDRWQFTSELGLIDFEFIGNAFIPNFGFTQESYYFQAAYQINAEWQTFARYDVLYTNRDDKDGNFATLLGLPRFTAFGKDTSVGIRYRPSKRWLVASELHLVRGTAGLTLTENPDRTQLEKDWKLFTVQASYRF